MAAFGTARNVADTSLLHGLDRRAGGEGGLGQRMGGEPSRAQQRLRRVWAASAGVGGQHVLDAAGEALPHPVGLGAARPGEPMSMPSAAKAYCPVEPR